MRNGLMGGKGWIHPSNTPFQAQPTNPVGRMYGR